MSGQRSVIVSLLVFVGGLAILFVGLWVLLWLRQDSFIFYPRLNDERYRQAWLDRRVEIRSGEHVLEGWWAENPGATRPTVVIYFGGNAEDVLYTAATSPHIEASKTLVVNYRGYGGTPGRPGELAFFEDARAIYDYVISTGVKPDEIVLMGRSLGSGVATMLASERPVRALILITPYDSLVAVAKGHYPFAPVEALLRHRFMSIDRAPRLHVPVLILAAQWDRVIPPVHARRLYEAWGGEKQIRVLEGVGHNDIQENTGYYEAINEFLRTH